MAYSNTLFQTLKKLAFAGFNQRSPNRMGLLSTSLSGLCSLTRLNLSYCNLNAIPNDICCLFSLKSLFLCGNDFSCLLENIAQLSYLKRMKVNNCTSLRSWPKLPLNIESVWAKGCTSLATLPNLLQPNSLFGGHVYLSKSNKLAENQGFTDMFLAIIINSPKLPFSIESGMFLEYRYDIVILGSEIPKWFRHQSIGDEVSIQEPYSLLCNEWMRIAVCVVFCSHSHHQTLKDCSISCCLIVNGKQVHVAPSIREVVPLSDHIWLLYLLPQFYEKEDIKSLLECDANGFCQIGIKIESLRWDLSKKFIPFHRKGVVKVKKCRLQMVYKKDIEDLNSITPYEGLDVPHHNFDNSMAVAAESYKAKRTRDDCDGAGSSNYEPHPKRIVTLTLRSQVSTRNVLKS
ncbi:hypothetical protein SO802_010886 [Lithocarpus litseifolius]|uniref:C-JID domain-containing protein n=1 Tax=Lithocarpus litseifolius TaxID=425828 RepID=A0AAW2DIJ4_9ROSI